MAQLHKKLRKIYKVIEESGLYINLNHDIRFHEKKEIPLNLNETETIVLADEAYNSPLLFALLTSVLRNGTMILYGSPGSGKTTSAEFVGAFVHGTLLEEAFGDEQGDFRVMEAIHEATIHGHQELTEEKMIGRPHLGKLMKEGEEDVIPRKFVLSPFRMVDEVNRLTPGRTNNLLEMMDRGFSVYGDSKIYAAEGATFLTANFRDVASSDLTPPFLDRIDVGVFSPTLNPYFLEMAAGGEDRKLTGDEETLVARLRKEIKVELTREDFEHIRSDIAGIDVESESRYVLYNFISELNGCALASLDIERKSKGFAWFVKPPVLCAQVDDGGSPSEGHMGGCHYHNTDNICFKTENEVSVRAGKTIERYAKALAWFRGNDKAGMEEVEAVIPHVLWFKLIPPTAPGWSTRSS
jgi:MoxR-like ATPase